MKNQKDHSAQNAPVDHAVPVIAGIGASAGGLEAFRALLPNLPTGKNISYVLVQHMDPRHNSMLISLLTDYTDKPVYEIKDNTKPEADKIYISPPGFHLTIAGNRFHLTESGSDIGPKPSIDRFFISLAEDREERCVGIVLSGTGSDGAHGIRAIKAHGGVTIVQDEKTARFNHMPHSAIDTGHVDLVLAPEKIGPELQDMARYPALIPKEIPRADAHADIDHILKMIHDKIGCDFSGYKTSTIKRRITRRMVLHKYFELDKYITHLADQPKELNLLVKDILISVTAFFRNREAFEKLGDIFPKILENRPQGPFRMWVPGCSTGEEAYSLAILADQAMQHVSTHPAIQIFASDLDPEAIDIARRGIYPLAALENIDHHLFNRYFNQKEDTAEVKDFLREKIIFARHDLIADPPFAHQDMISCRNLLIYFNQELQSRVIPLFHYVLNSNGYLFLGQSESISQYSDLFEPISKKHKIFKRKQGSKGFVPFYRKKQISQFHQNGQFKSKQTAVSPQDRMNQAVLKLFGPAAVLVNSQLEVVYFRGDTSPYLRPPEGEVNLDVVRMAKAGIRLDLRTLIHRCLREKKSFHSGPINPDPEAPDKQIVIHVAPPDGETIDSDLILVAFETLRPYHMKSTPIQASTDEDPRIYELEQELTDTKEQLQTTIEELETSNEELMSLNEELQSANEELQSSNEELETTTEELQSTNEELNTVNQELQIKSNELTATNMDMENILKQIGLPIMIVDNDLKISRYNEKAGDLFSLKPSDTGQIITMVASHIGIENLRSKLNRVIQNNQVHKEVIVENGSVFCLTIHPYLAEESQCMGAIMIFMDETELREKNNELETMSQISQMFLETESLSEIFKNLPDLLAKRFDFSHVLIERYNPGTGEMTMVGDNLEAAIFNATAPIPSEDTICGKVINTGTAHTIDFKSENRQNQHTVMKVPGIQYAVCLPLKVEHKILGTITLAGDMPKKENSDLIKTLTVISNHLGSEVDRKENQVRLKSAQEQLKKQNEVLESIFANTHFHLAYMDRAFNFIRVNQAYADSTGHPLDYFKGKNYFDMFPHKENQAVFEEVKNTGIASHADAEPLDIPNSPHPGTSYWSWTLVPIKDDNNRVERLLLGMVDVTEQKQAEQARQKSEKDYRELKEKSLDGYARMDMNGRFLEVNAAFERITGYTADDLLHLTYNDITPKKWHGKENFLLKKLLKEGHTPLYEKEYFRKDGSVIPVELRRYLLKAPNGTPEYMWAFFRDIAQRKQSEQRLKQNAQKLKESNAALRDFVFIASHDLQEPLRKIRAFGDLLAQSAELELDSRHRDYLKRMINASGRMSTLIKDLLSYSRVSNEHFDFALVDLNETLKEVLSNLETHIQQANGRIEVEKLPTVPADPTQMAQLFQNLLSNAVKFQADGHIPRIKVGISPPDNEAGIQKGKETPADFYSIYIQDNGIGMNMEFAHKIFMPFHRLHGRTEYDGTGIGLAICKKIVERHNGMINVSANPEGGTIFTIHLPKESQ